MIQRTEGRRFIASGSVIFLGLLLAALTGTSQVYLPFLGPGLVLGLLLGPLILIQRLEHQVALILLALLLSRLVQAAGFPSLINYVHFGLLCIIILRVLIFAEPLGPQARSILFASTGLGAFIAASGILGDWFALRPMLFWLTFAGPFILFAVCISMPPSRLRVVRHTIVALGLVQIPFSMVQFIQFGAGDFVQGTLVMHGAGHHVMGAITVLAAGTLFLAFPNLPLRLRIMASGMMFAMGILSDAKQVYVAVVVGSLPLYLYILRRKPQLIPVGLIGALVAIIGGAVLNPALYQTFTPEIILYNLELKWRYAGMAMDQLGPLTSAFGYGPGVGASRIALLTLPEYGNVPSAIVGDGPAPIAEILWQADRARWVSSMGSSTNSPFNSILGLVTDIGVIGTLFFFYICGMVWRQVGKLSPLSAAFGKSSLLSALALGMIYVWLDEPVYSMFLAVVLGSLLRPEEVVAS